MELSSPTLIKTGINKYNVSHGNDEGLYVEFDTVAVKQEFASIEAGRPIYKDVVMITIMFPGDKTKKVHRPVNDEDKRRFPRQWEEYERTGKVEMTGTPLQEWSLLTRSEVAEFKSMNIHSVEQLSALPDSSLTWLGARSLRDKAKSWLESAKGSAELISLMEKNEQLEKDVEMLKKQINEISQQKSKRKETE